MKIRFEIEDVECLEYTTMLTAMERHLKNSGNRNILLDGTIMALHDYIMKAMINQLPPDRLDEIIK